MARRFTRDTAHLCHWDEIRRGASSWARQSFGSLAAGMIAQAFGGYSPIGPLGLITCLVAVLIVWPIARRVERQGRTLAVAAAH